MSQRAEILPCPFCGKKPDTFPKNPKVEGNAWGEVRCVNRRCATFSGRSEEAVAVGDGSLINDERGTEAYIRAAIKRWNRRSNQGGETK